jgi:hypothetical protein
MDTAFLYGSTAPGTDLALVGLLGLVGAVAAGVLIALAVGLMRMRARIERESALHEPPLGNRESAEPLRRRG